MLNKYPTYTIFSIDEQLCRQCLLGLLKIMCLYQNTLATIYFRMSRSVSFNLPHGAA